MPKLYYASPRDLPVIEPHPGVKGRVVHAQHATLIVYDYAPRTIVETHKHTVEQFGVVVKGSLAMVVAGEQRILMVGDTFRFPRERRTAPASSRSPHRWCRCSHRRAPIFRGRARTDPPSRPSEKGAPAAPGRHGQSPDVSDTCPTSRLPIVLAGAGAFSARSAARGSPRRVRRCGRLAIARWAGDRPFGRRGSGAARGDVGSGLATRSRARPCPAAARGPGTSRHR